MNKPHFEECFFCSRPTGKAGPMEDSIYISWLDGEIGPLCEECYHAICASIDEDRGMTNGEVEG